MDLVSLVPWKQKPVRQPYRKLRPHPSEGDPSLPSCMGVSGEDERCAVEAGRLGEVRTLAAAGLTGGPCPRAAPRKPAGRGK